MWASAGRPKIGTEPNCLGTRVGTDRPDIVPDADGTVRPGTGGLSVSPAPDRLPPHLIPKRLLRLFPGAKGSNNKPALIPWRMGDGPFVDGPVTDDLVFRLDPVSPD